jgi:hypothetical protein
LTHTISVLSHKRGIAIFFVGYMAINVISTVLTLLVANALHISLSGQTVNIHNHAVAVAERFYPLANLPVWLVCSWLYFRNHTDSGKQLNEAWRLGALWLVLGVLCNEIFFVLIRTSYSFSAHDWYIGQSPWIYLIYLIAFLSPVVYVSAVGALRKP